MLQLVILVFIWIVVSFNKHTKTQVDLNSNGLSKMNNQVDLRIKNEYFEWK